MSMFSLSDYLMRNADKLAMQKIRYQRIDKGDYIYTPADDKCFVYLIEKGIVKIGGFSSLGERIVYDVLQPGETFGNLHYLDNDGIEFVEFAQAATKIDLFVINLSFFRNIIVNDPVVAEWFNIVTIRRWHRAETMLLHRSVETAENRILCLRKKYGVPVKDADNRMHDVFGLLSHREIADLIGATRQTVSKKLKDLMVR